MSAVFPAEVQNLANVKTVPAVLDGKLEKSCVDLQNGDGSGIRFSK